MSRATSVIFFTKPMYIRLIFTILTVCVATIACKSGNKLTKEKNWDGLLNILNASHADESKAIRYDGVYCWTNSQAEVRNERIRYLAPVMFYKNGLMYADQFSYLDSSILRYQFITSNNHHDEIRKNFGVYKLNHDTLDCFFYTGFIGRGLSVKSRIAHYTGILKGSDTITKWHMIPPYPKISPNFRDLEDSSAPKTAVVKPFPADLLDADKIWLNKYRATK